MRVSQILLLIVSISVLLCLGGLTPDDVAAEQHAQRWTDSASVGVIDRGWKFEVELYKTQTVTYEPIYMRFRITNVSSETRIMPFLSYLTPFDEPLLRIELHDAKGQHISLATGHFDSSTPLDTNAVQKGPGGSNVLEYDLLARVGTGSEACRLFGLPAGDYVANISFYTDPLQRAARSENTLILPPLSFTIVEPTGDAAEALRLLCQAGSLRGENPEAAQSCYDSILTYYAQTPLDERANIELIYYRSMGRHLDRQQLVRARERYLLKYLNTPLSEGNVNELIPRVSAERMKELVAQIRDKPEAAGILRHLREHHPWIFEGLKR